MHCILRSPVHTEVFPVMGSYWGSQYDILKAEGFLKSKVPVSHRGGVEDDLRVIEVISRHHLSRESGKRGSGWWLGHHGSLLGLE